MWKARVTTYTVLCYHSAGKLTFWRPSTTQIVTPQCPQNCRTMTTSRIVVGVWETNTSHCSGFSNLRLFFPKLIEWWLTDIWGQTRAHPASNTRDGGSTAASALRLDNRGSEAGDYENGAGRPRAWSRRFRRTAVTAAVGRQKTHAETEFQGGCNLLGVYQFILAVKGWRGFEKCRAERSRGEKRYKREEKKENKDGVHTPTPPISYLLVGKNDLSSACLFVFNRDCISPVCHNIVTNQIHSKIIF